MFAVSTFTKGEQMVPVLNQVGVHCSVYGNHDFGESQLLLSESGRELSQLFQTSGWRL